MSRQIQTEKITVGNWEWFYREIPNDANPLTVILLHGIPAHSYTWRNLMPLIASAGYRVIAPDWLGSGFSSKPNKREFKYTTTEFTKVLGEFIAALELEKIALVTQGFGASAGIQYALNHPHIVEKLIILNTPIAANTKLPWLMQQWTIPLVGDMLTQDPLLVDRTLEKGSGFVIEDKDLDKLRKPYLETSAVGRALISITKQLNLKETGETLSLGLETFNKPSLILWGLADSWLDAQVARAIAASNEKIEFVGLEGAKHYPQEHWSKEIAPELLSFLRR